ncbi:GGDEF domain-containing protein [Castellaniella sp.]|uniref:GGDEF domain-containing protein n=1 Tax=Castellaniella sp. TaxID=1955812 RepID=UPI002AFF5C45|nr:GGDEF domain-containing protein [Castellaniella sp.]
MVNFDPRTLLVVEAFVLFLVGGLTFLAAIQGRRERTLLWCATGMWLACLGFLLGVTREYADLLTLSIIVTNMLMITGHACLWISLRVFGGRPVSWRWLGAGALVWLLLCQWPAFLSDTDLRVAAYSVLCLGYLGAALTEVWPEWRRYPGVATPLIVFLAIHALFYLYRIPASPMQPQIWRNWPDFTLVMFEGLFFAISLSFSILMMVRARAERNYRYAALHDVLTGLPNRRALFEQGELLLEQARPSGVDVAVLMCDLDWFKQVNDNFGHEAGDRVLACFAQILSQSVDAQDLRARLGGEEFVVVAANLGPLGAQELATRIRSGLSAQTDSLPCCLTVSVGIACSRQAGYDLDRLLARADQALYAAKTAGRDCIRVWPVAEAAGHVPSVAVARSRGGRLGEQPVDA